MMLPPCQKASLLSDVLWLQAQLWLDSVNHQTIVGHAMAKHVPHVFHIHGRSVMQFEKSLRHIEAANLDVLKVSHAWWKQFYSLHC